MEKIRKREMNTHRLHVLIQSIHNHTTAQSDINTRGHISGWQAVLRYGYSNHIDTRRYQAAHINIADALVYRHIEKRRIRRTHSINCDCHSEICQRAKAITNLLELAYYGVFLWV